MFVSNQVHIIISDLSCDCGNCSKFEPGNVVSVGVRRTGLAATGGRGESAVDTWTSGIVE